MLIGIAYLLHHWTIVLSRWSDVWLECSIIVGSSPDGEDTRVAIRLEMPFQASLFDGNTEGAVPRNMFKETFDVVVKA